MNANTSAEGKPTRRRPNEEWNDEVVEAIQTPRLSWQDPAYEADRFATAGLWLGALAGCTSLLINVIGSVLWPAISGQAQHPLRIIQVYLTFPLGESALSLDSGVVLAAGCVLYMCIGMLYGMLFELMISFCVPRADLRARLVICSILALGVWVINFYALIAWVQPMLFGGCWVVDLVPWWVAATTHLVFGWTMAVIYPLANVRH